MRHIKNYEPLVPPFRGDETMMRGPLSFIPVTCTLSPVTCLPHSYRWDFLLQSLQYEHHDSVFEDAWVVQ